MRVRLTDGALIGSWVIDFIIANRSGGHVRCQFKLCLFHLVGVHVWQLLHVNVGGHLLLLVVVVVRILHLLRRLSKMNCCFINALLLVCFNCNVTVHAVEVFFCVGKHNLFLKNYISEN